MIYGSKKRSYEDPIFQISNLYVIRFDLQTLLKLIEKKEEKLRKRLKIAISRSKLKISKNKKNHF